MKRSSKRSKTTPHTTASSSSNQHVETSLPNFNIPRRSSRLFQRRLRGPNDPEEIRKIAFNVLMKVRNDPALTLAVSSVNKSARSSAEFPKPKNITSYYKNVAKCYGCSYNKFFRGKTPPGHPNPNNGYLVYSKSIEQFLKKFSLQTTEQANQDKKRNRFYLFNESKLNKKVPNIYKQLVEAIQNQESVRSKSLTSHKRSKRYPVRETSKPYKSRFIGIMYDAAQ